MKSTRSKEDIQSEKVQLAIDAIISEVRKVCPDAKVNTSLEQFEDEDAIVFAYAPDSMIERLQRCTHQVAIRFLLDFDVDIAVLIRPETLWNQPIPTSSKLAEGSCS